MNVGKKTFSEDDYFKLLKIESEDDLFRNKKENESYVYVTLNDKNEFIEDTKHMCIVTRFVVDEMKWLIMNRCTDFRQYQDVLVLFNKHLEFYLTKLKLYHNKAYVSIYTSFTNDVMNEYETKLQPLFNEYLNIGINRNEDNIWDLAELVTFDGNTSCSNPVKNQAKENDIDVFFHHLFKGVIDSLNNLIMEVKFVVTAIYHTSIFRDKGEEGIIYNYIKKSFDETKLDDHLAQKKREYKHYLEDRRMPMDIEFLRTKLNDLDQISNNFKLCKIWMDSVNADDEVEDFAYKLSREQATPTLFEVLFQYQGERKMLRDEIAKIDDLERNGDPLFARWVDPIKLEEYLKYWIKANIKSQEKWYIVWCLMKYTFDMIKEGVGKNDFAERMNFMFPKSEKKCVVESFRKQETKMNHNCHFSKWLNDSDPDYPIAQSLYDKLKEKISYQKG